jgi:MYXO-CTERM domain-containing protein
MNRFNVPAALVASLRLPAFATGTERMASGARPSALAPLKRWGGRLAVAALASSGLQAQAAPVTDVQFLSGTPPGCTAPTPPAGCEVLNLVLPGQVLAGNQVFAYNTIDDLSGDKLVTGNGDLNDFLLSGNSTVGALGYGRVALGATAAATPFPAVATSRVQASHGFTTSVTSNNPGSVTANSFQLLFNTNLVVTAASFNFSSLNTAGLTWEYSVIQFLDAAGSPFSAVAAPALTFTPGASSQYLLAGAGFSGQAGLGNYVAALTRTVLNVANSDPTSTSNATRSGTNGSDDNLLFNYARAGLTANTQVGGIRWTTYLEDVRNTDNNSTNLTSSLLDFSITGTVSNDPGPVPIPGPLPLLGVAAAFGSARRLRQRIRQMSGFVPASGFRAPGRPSAERCHR